MYRALRDGASLGAAEIKQGFSRGLDVRNDVVVGDDVAEPYKGSEWSCDKEARSRLRSRESNVHKAQTRHCRLEIAGVVSRAIALQL